MIGVRYQPGDRVRIVSQRVGFGWNSDGAMDHWLGQIMTVAYVEAEDGRAYYHMEEDQGELGGYGWWWYLDMIEGFADEPEENEPFEPASLEELSRLLLS